MQTFFFLKKKKDLHKSLGMNFTSQNGFGALEVPISSQKSK